MPEHPCTHQHLDMKGHVQGHAPHMQEYILDMLLPNSCQIGQKVDES